MKFEPIVIPPVDSIESLRLAVINAFNRLTYRIRTVDTKFTGDMDANQNRLINLNDPSQPLDAVNKQYVDNLVNKGVTVAGGNLTITTNTVLAPFIISY